jgi:hypothetical protein
MADITIPDEDVPAIIRLALRGFDMLNDDIATRGIAKQPREQQQARLDREAVQRLINVL